MRLHVVSLPHTHTTADHATCAYTQKVRKFGKMMTAAGHQVVVYSGEHNDTVCAEHVPLLSEAERAGWFGSYDAAAIHPITWDPGDEHWLVMNARAIEQISRRADDPRDELVCLSSGWCQQMIAAALPSLIACEPFVGYEGIATSYCAFESHAWRNHVYGLRQWRQGRWYDATIPNFFDLDEFPHIRASAGEGDYLLFLGRVTQLKGPDVAAMIAGRAGLPLKIAGPGVAGQNRADRRAGILHGDHIDITGSHVDYVGPVGIEERAELLAGARAVLMPTRFIEPFGGVAVEAMLAGVPVIAPDWGAFTETIAEGETGFRFRTLAEAVDAVGRCDELDPAAIHAQAKARYSLEAVAPQFERWFGNLEGLWDVGWAA